MLVVEKPLPHYVPPPPSKENLEYADLAIIDLSKATTPEGRAELSRQVCEALTEVGFFYIINHGYTSAKTSRIFDIANATFDSVSDEEKQEYTQKEVGVYTGYKPMNDWHIASGVRDAIEHYNSSYPIPTLPRANAHTTGII
ncbi:hypothetical protein PC9H_000112 [Pleurotus ostreatus]|uniref:Non-haem dioxygenase N-terminal domain-containing protein n=1 Tax=Pleurotus ostreatus TaxID=5322 RepID=A0A8H7DZ24_PLEOS|nr:uncharacterized protein PC9H_000112 [Pleurotus ostreatus]KAF7439776.1 hypothetical protein PC9H_000112 [Pleurotus ostreatus]